MLYQSKWVGCYGNKCLPAGVAPRVTTTVGTATRIASGDFSAEGTSADGVDGIATREYGCLCAVVNNLNAGGDICFLFHKCVFLRMVKHVFT